MKNNIIYTLALTASLSVFSRAQNTGVGINTANPQGSSFHIDGGKDNNTTTVPTTAQQQNDFYVEGTTGRVGVGTTSPKVKLDLRNASNGQGAIGIGRGAATAEAVDEGAMKYDPAQTGNNAKIVYSNGRNWIPLWVGVNPPQKVKVIAEKITTTVKTVHQDWSPAVYGRAGNGTNKNDTSGTPSVMMDERSNYLISWNKKYENDGTNNTNYFDATTGLFTAPRAGTYVATFTYAINARQLNAPNSLRSEAIWDRYNSSGLLEANLLEAIKCVNSYTSTNTLNANQIAGANCTAAFKLNAGDRLAVSAWFNHANTSGTTTSTLNTAAGYTTLTIVEQ